MNQNIFSIKLFTPSPHYFIYGGEYFSGLLTVRPQRVLLGGVTGSEKGSFTSPSKF